MPTNSSAVLSITPVGYEQFTWKPIAPELFSRNESQRQTGPYQAAVPAEISAWLPLLSGEVMSEVEDASRQVSAFDQHARLTLGFDNPALGPMSAILLRTESASSSQIERLTASARQLALAELNEDARSNALTVVGNVRAMEAALELSEDISEDSILKMHRALMIHQSELTESEIGAYRLEQVWIGDGIAGPRTAEFVPPSKERVPGSVADLVRFLNRQDLPTLVQAAVGHAQFETIHPFLDGNGRTGRALVHSLLKAKKFTSATTLPLSAGLLTNVPRYFKALETYRRGDAGPIVLEFARAAQRAAVTGRALVDDLVEQLDLSNQKLAGIRSDATARQILPLLISQPVINTRALQQHFGIGEMAGLRAMKLLSERGVITELTGWRRARIWEHSGIIRVLDDYAKQVRRSLNR